MKDKYQYRVVFTQKEKEELKNISLFLGIPMVSVIKLALKEFIKNKNKEYR